MRPKTLEEIARQNVANLRRAHLDGAARAPDDLEMGREADRREHWSQGSVARRLGTTRPTYQAIENGTRGIGVNDLCALAHVFDVSPVTLVLPQLGGATRVPVVALGSSEFLASPGLRRFHAWWKGEKPLGGQEGGFFYRHATAQHSPVTADGRQRGLDRNGPSTAALREPEVEDARRALERLFEAIRDDDDTAREHHHDVLEDCLDRADRRQAGEIVDTLDYWKSKWASRRGQRGGGQDD
jgi:transcriptional regulator with XRE-family HTH domain